MLISKATIKEIKSLQQPKFRQMYNKFVSEGEKACLEFIKSQKYRILMAACTEVFGHRSLLSEALPPSTVYVVSQKDMEQMSLLKTPTDILLVLERKEDDAHLITDRKARIIYLDGVQDPGNVGTIIRIADWFGIDAVIRSQDSADFFNPKVVQATMGSMNNVILYTASLDENLCTGRRIAGTYMEGTPIHQANLTENTVLVLGSEGRGISESAARCIQDRVNIPGVEGKIAESLNVAVAAGIICASWKP
jgi:TrmH family RNA methyltransferase